MGRVLSTIIAVALLLGLGALAVLALPGTGVPMTASPVAAAPLAAEPDAPALAAQNYNVIALPLDSQSQFTSYDAPGLAALVGQGVKQVLTWNPGTQTYLSWNVDLGDGDYFTLNLGGVYWLLLDSSASNVVSFVGDVPAQNSVSFALTRPASSGCLLNDISIPLDQSGIASPQDLAVAVGGVAQVLQWNATTQTFLSWNVDLQDGDTFDVRIGYPYRLCLKPNPDTTWP